jgi:ABC-type dipeptide/oligopeptide/nickel transport system permease component
MALYLCRRLFHGMFVLIAVSIIIFTAVHMAPGDPALMMMPNFGGTLADREVLANIRQRMGLDRPLHIQYLDFVARLGSLDFGNSLHAHIPVRKMLGERVGATVELTVLSMLFATVVAIPLGIASARRRNGLVDVFGRMLALLGVATPSFWLGLMLILILAVHFRILPTGGRTGWASYILPAFTLGIQQVALVTRLTRSSLVEILRKEYIKVARAKGLAEGRVIWMHALRNVLIPVITVMGLQFGTLLGGAVVTETVFSWPGVGRMAIEAILNRDYPVVQATVFVFSLMFVILNILIDVCYMYLDPRVRLA